jgi:hypothetical protein
MLARERALMPEMARSPDISRDFAASPIRLTAGCAEPLIFSAVDPRRLVINRARKPLEKSKSTLNPNVRAGD